LVTPSCRPYLVDFDQASVLSIAGALKLNFLGVPNMVENEYGFVPMVRGMLSVLLPKSLKHLARKLFGREPARPEPELPIIRSDSDDSVRLLYQAWQIARESGANSPGDCVAYYSLEYGGYQFPGERPWLDRWTILRGITDYSGKRVLELGCNMGLLSCFLLRHSGVSAALGVDCSDSVLRSAEVIARAFVVQPTFARVDLDSAENWECGLQAFCPDVVFALNVLNWVKDKGRLLSFLGRFREVIFEGHDAVEVEKMRLAEVGFVKIKEIGQSERRRAILYCSR
jgi:hypothetical protein